MTGIELLIAGLVSMYIGFVFSHHHKRIQQLEAQVVKQAFSLRLLERDFSNRYQVTFPTIDNEP